MVFTCTFTQVTCDRYGVAGDRCGVTRVTPYPCKTWSTGRMWVMQNLLFLVSQYSCKGLPLSKVVLDMGKGNPSGTWVGVLRVWVRVQVFVPITIPIPIPTRRVYFIFIFHFYLFVYLVTSYHCDIVTISALPNTTTTTTTAPTIIRHKYEPQGGRKRNM